MNAFNKIVDAAVAAGWGHEPCGSRPAGGGWAQNPAALSIGGSCYSTLLRHPVRIGLCSTEIYYHDGRVWWGDSTVARDDQVTVAGIVVDKQHRRQGHGKAAVRSLQSIAGLVGVSLLLEATPLGGEHKAARLTQRRLVQWYKSLGFVPAYPGEGDAILIWRPSS